MKRSPVADDPRHYQSHDGRILPVGGTHECRCPGDVYVPSMGLAPHRSDCPAAPCTTCNFTPTRPTAFIVGQKVAISRTIAGRRQVIGLVSKVGRRFVTVSWTSTTGRRHESKRRPSDVVPAVQL